MSPDKFRTIPDVLRYWALHAPTQVAYRLLDERGVETESLTFSELLSTSERVGHRALGRYKPGDRVILIYPTSFEFLFAFFGCILAGLIPVPYPTPKRGATKALESVAADCNASCIFCMSNLKNALTVRHNGNSTALPPILNIQDLLSDDVEVSAIQFSDVRIEENDIALIQYTSGSTSKPKGVEIRHSNVISNQRMIRDAFDHRGSLVVVAWAPLYHDQGLIGNVIQPLFVGGCSVMLPPVAFFRDPMLWLELISRYKAHTSGGPNFTFEACVSRYDKIRASTLDLSCWKVAFNGAEPISVKALREFSKIFHQHGFSTKAFFPCYGLAEGTLFVSGGPAHNGYKVFSSPDGTGDVVGAGVVHPDVELVIINIEQELVSDGKVGEICVRGSSITEGYWGKNKNLLEDFISISGNPDLYFATGDLGFLDDGVLYVTGRKKELMILRGRNIYPYDIENTISASHEAFRLGRCAVFSKVVDGDNCVFSVQEINRESRGAVNFSEIAGVVRRNVLELHDLMIHRICFVQFGFLPKTTSGKIKRLTVDSVIADPLNKKYIYGMF